MASSTQKEHFTFEVRRKNFEVRRMNVLRVRANVPSIGLSEQKSISPAEQDPKAVEAPILYLSIGSMSTAEICDV